MESNEHLISEGVKVPDVNKVEKNDKLTLKVNSDTQKPKESDRNELIDKTSFQTKKKAAFYVKYATITGNFGVFIYRKSEK